MRESGSAKRRSVSFFPRHERLVDTVARQLGYKPEARSFSPTLQYILDDYERRLATADDWYRSAPQNDLVTGSPTVLDTAPLRGVVPLSDIADDEEQSS